MAGRAHPVKAFQLTKPPACQPGKQRRVSPKGRHQSCPCLMLVLVCSVVLYLSIAIEKRLSARLVSSVHVAHEHPRRIDKADMT